MGINNHKLGLIMGSNRFKLDSLDKYSIQRIENEYGTTILFVGEKSVVLSRHGDENNIPPHKINHHSNMFAFYKLGVKNVLSLTSVGSLKHDLKPTQMLMPDDYINLGEISSYFNNKIQHIVPGLADDLREDIYNRIKGKTIEVKFNGIYIQTQGPRLETKAEIKMLKDYGDVVGMTMAAEATLAKELGLKYANLSVVDNYCHGLLDEPLTIESIKENQSKNSRNIEDILQELISN